MKKKLIIFTLLSVLFSFSGMCQSDSTATADTSTIEKKISLTPPRIAGYLSAIVPAAGQVYNKQYWKVPLIYGIGGLFVYTIINNQKGFKRYNTAYNAATDEDESTTVEFELEGFTTNNIQIIRESYRRKRDVFVIYSSLIYVANIVDAVVGAHLRDFDLSEDLSFHISPTMYAFNNDLATGVSLQFKLK